MKTVIVTGGSRGIGAAIVKELAKNNYNVVLNYNNSAETAKQIQNELKENADVKYITAEFGGKRSRLQRGTASVPNRKSRPANYFER